MLFTTMLTLPAVFQPRACQVESQEQYTKYQNRVKKWDVPVLVVINVVVLGVAIILGSYV